MIIRHALTAGQSGAGGQAVNLRRISDNNGISIVSVFILRYQFKSSHIEYIDPLPSANTRGVIERVKELFEGHESLLAGFNNFLPQGRHFHRAYSS